MLIGIDTQNISSLSCPDTYHHLLYPATTLQTCFFRIYLPKAELLTNIEHMRVDTMVHETMTCGVSMTETQKLICVAHASWYPKVIIKLDGMARVSKRQVRDYLHLVTHHSESRELAEQIEAYIERNGLPKEFAAVIGYIWYLKTVVES